jgi:hypothetical protein
MSNIIKKLKVQPGSQGEKSSLPAQAGKRHLMDVKRDRFVAGLYAHLYRLFEHAEYNI